jgi:hypothetical protein
MADTQNQIAVWEKRITDLKAGVEKKSTYIKWGVGVALLILFGPMVLTGLITGIGIILAGAVVFALTQFAPVFGRFIANKSTEMAIAEANRHLEALKAEARRSPIETMQNVYLEQGRQLKARYDLIEKFSTKVNKYGMQVQDLKEKFPKDAATFDRVHADMTLLLQKRREKWREANAAHEQAGNEIERAQAIWEMSQATLALRESAGDVEAEFMQRIRKETAVDAVQESLAAAMSQLDALLDEQIPLSPVEKKAISNNPSPVLEVQDVTVKQGVAR